MRRAIGLLILALTLAQTRAAEPTHTAIDRIIAAKAKADGIPLAGKSDDAEFLRRVWLDLAGTIPSSDVAKRFLAD